MILKSSNVSILWFVSIECLNTWDHCDLSLWRRSKSFLVIMDKSKYHEKCLMTLGNCNFKTLDHDPPKKAEEKIERILWKMKNIISD